jgi:hypothetical protein
VLRCLGTEQKGICPASHAFRYTTGNRFLLCGSRLPYAIAYALGGELAESFLYGTKVRRGYPEPRAEWGYLFVVPGEALGAVQPDEDSVGEMVADGTAPGWLAAKARASLTGVHLPRSSFSDPEAWADYRELGWDLYELATSPNAFQLVAQAEAGKILLAGMSSEEELELIALGAHVAHQGKVVPTQCWRIDKSEAPRLARDGSNFFDLAERRR